MAALAKVAKRFVKQRILRPTTYRWHRALASLEGRHELPILLTTDEDAYTSDQQYAPIGYHAALLRKRLGVSVRLMTVAEALRLRPEALRAFAMVGVKLSFRTRPQPALTTIRTFRERLGGGSTRLVYFDGDDDLMVQWPEVLPLVDAYVKKHMLRDLAAYRPGIGKSNLTDYVARQHGVSFDDDPIPRFAGVPAALAHKLHLGWNIGFDDKIRRLGAQVPPNPVKDIDVSCRAGLPSDWIRPLRKPVLDLLEGTQTRWRVLTPRQRVDQAQYNQELLRSRICVSPFGYGEICWRDFEAIICGCLLVKPDMGHLQTYPDVFVPGETYVPVRWDFSDLIEKCEPYVADEAARLRVVTRAREVLEAATQPEAFLSRFADVLRHAGVLATESAVETTHGAIGA